MSHLALPRAKPHASWHRPLLSQGDYPTSAPICTPSFPLSTGQPIRLSPAQCQNKRARQTSRSAEIRRWPGSSSAGMMCADECEREPILSHSRSAKQKPGAPKTKSLSAYGRGRDQNQSRALQALRHLCRDVFGAGFRAGGDTVGARGARYRSMHCVRPLCGGVPCGRDRA